MKPIVFILLVTLISACSSTKDQRELDERENERIKRDYLVRDASSNYRPGWIEDAELWAKQHGLDVGKYRYFSYETTPKVARDIACNIAEGNAKSQIAGEISTFIEKSLATYSEGNASIDLNDPDLKPMKEFVESSLVQKTIAMIHGASTYKKYWEKRQYLKDRGAKKDFIGYTCSVYVRMESDGLKKLVKRAADNVGQKASELEMKAKVDKALKDADENFVKARQGLI